MDLTKSAEIKAGLQKSFLSGTSAKASTVCYGYRLTANGALLVYPAEAIIVFHIFDRFAAGDSLGQITASLARMKVLSPTGRETWSRETVSKILSNEKYTGDVVLGKTVIKDGVQVKAPDANQKVVVNHHHPAIISQDLFEAVTQEKHRRAKARKHMADR